MRLPDLSAALLAAEAEGNAFWDRFTDDEFFAPIGVSWSPAFTVRHLNTSMRAVTQGLGLPRVVLRVLFGSSDRSSQSPEALRQVYRRALAAGGRAGRFTPRAEPTTPDRPRRIAIMRAHHDAVASLVAAAGKWDEAAADRLRLPHPLIGKLTVREMLCFTLDHNRHHVRVVQQRQAGRDVAELYQVG